MLLLQLKPVAKNVLSAPRVKNANRVHRVKSVSHVPNRP
jgi:hypothetical protein